MELDPGNPTVAEAMNMAMRWLEVRGRSRAQVEARLRHAGFTSDVAEGVGERLSELGILSDRAFALAGVETGLRRGLARPYLRLNLERRGVGEDDATWALEESANQEPDETRALRLAEAWVRAHPVIAAGLWDRAFRRLAGVLARKGYEAELVGDVCRTVLGEPPDPADFSDSTELSDFAGSTDSMPGFGDGPAAGLGDGVQLGVAGVVAAGGDGSGSIDPPWGRS